MPARSYPPVITMPYQVTIASSGHTFDVEPAETVLDAALRQGIILPYGCRNGNCGNCKGDILSGSVDYEDGLPPALNDEDAAQNRALFCQAHPNCDLTIKVREVDAALVGEREGVEHLVYASSSSVYGDGAVLPFTEDQAAGRPLSLYAATKRAGELVAHTFHHAQGLSVACVRFFTAYGPRQRPDSPYAAVIPVFTDL